MLCCGRTERLPPSASRCTQADVQSHGSTHVLFLPCCIFYAIFSILMSSWHLWKTQLWGWKPVWIPASTTACCTPLCRACRSLAVRLPTPARRWSWTRSTPRPTTAAATPRLRWGTSRMPCATSGPPSAWRPATQTFAARCLHACCCSVCLCVGGGWAQAVCAPDC